VPAHVPVRGGILAAPGRWADFSRSGTFNADRHYPEGCCSRGIAVAKSQQKSNKEVRKPKAEKAPKANASNPSTKGTPAESSPAKRK
jgi:hypothetical protein